eukprot:TRINITY_DN23815_c0_g1_i2.p1 TRINITY_DN23815_c0_g1~~TRINITY_DN23815_c0_g1_i2.p1  ORF type:complete len:947 (+),score=151.89 TRINITY_DN23815_c0_g1_i2:128-2968(+)
MRDSWRRFLGLASRALLITVQRFLDVRSVAAGLFAAGHSSWAPWFLLAGLLATTVLMAATMQRHWSAYRRGQPHGCLTGTVAALLQVAPVYEMLDKVLFSQRLRDRGRSSSYRRYRALPPDLAGGSAHESLLQNESPQTRSPVLGGAPRSDLPKGSPGENVMRGVRKMSMVNLPQAMLSLWVHASELVPLGQTPLLDIWVLGLAFLAAFLCTAFGTADFVLYIWVHDAFVRQNKKLVTLHYCVEILSRVPAVVLFHVSYSRMRGYLPTLLLFLADVLLTSVLLLMSRLGKPVSARDAARCCLGSCFSRQSFTQFLYSLVISVQLFVVNVVFFDPGFIFCYVNQAFYVIKYVELAAMLHLIRECQGSGILIDLPRSALDAFCWGELTAAGVSAALVWSYVPLRRRQKDAHLTSNPSSGKLAGLAASAMEEGRSRAESKLSASGSGSSSAGGRTLERLEEIFEMLLLLGRASCGRNRAHILELTVKELWHQVMCWEGEYDDAEGGTVQISACVAGQPACVTRFGSSGSFGELDRMTATLDGPRITLQVPSSAAGDNSCQFLRQGRFNGSQILWQDGRPSWTRRTNFEGSFAEAQEVLHLILPQLALALRWDTPTTSGRNGNSDLKDRSCGPLLEFLVRYALMTQQATFVSELYWTLVCLSHEEESGNCQPKGSNNQVPQKPYEVARLALLRSLNQDSVDAEQTRFLSEAKQLLRSQKELWRQKLQLLVHIGHLNATKCSSCGSAPMVKVPSRSPSGSGAWAHRSEALRNALRHWPELQRRFHNVWKLDEDEVRLACGEGEESANLSAKINLVHPESTMASLPIDPALTFRGVIPEECAIVPSTNGPVLFACNMGLRSSPNCAGVAEHTVRERYMVKVGDDLRQDQLILQILDLMCCVWQDRLSRHEAGLLLQLAKFRVLAVTPRASLALIAHTFVCTDRLCNWLLFFL